MENKIYAEIKALEGKVEEINSKLNILIVGVKKINDLLGQSVADIIELAKKEKETENDGFVMFRGFPDIKEKEGD